MDKSKKNIKANLLYRLSIDGPEISTFHKLCDNKGPTLTLFDLKCGNKIGYYVSDSIDSDSGWKKYEHTFLFNLNQNTKYKKKIINIVHFTVSKIVDLQQMD